MIELLNLIFGVGEKQLPSAGEILRAATIFNQKKKTGTHSVYIGSAVPSSVDGEHQSRKKTGTHSLCKSSVIVGLLVSVLSFCYYYLIHI